MPFTSLLLLAAATAGTVPQPVNPVSAPAKLVYLADASRGADRSEVLVLGTAHLQGLPANFDRARLIPLIDRLVQWHPQIIAVEQLTGAQCDYLRQFRFAYTDTAENYCYDPMPARKALALDQVGAETEIERILAKPSDNRPPAERRQLAALFLAAGDPASAAVQWRRLPEAERKADGRISPELVDTLNRVKKPNETFDIAVALAVRMGLERVYPVDDHTGDRATGPTEDKFGETLMSVWKGTPGADAAHARNEAATQRFIAGGDVLAWYRSINSQSALADAVRFDFAAAAADKGADRVGRRYLAYWETRNLRMVANIRQAMGPTPGARVLAIVGSSHKPYYERYLGVMSEVHIADVQAVLK